MKDWLLNLNSSRASITPSCNRARGDGVSIPQAKARIFQHVTILTYSAEEENFTSA